VVVTVAPICDRLSSVTVTYVLSLNKGRSAHVALVVSKVDCYSTVLAGVSVTLYSLIDSIVSANAAARLVLDTFRLRVYVYGNVNGNAPRSA